MAYSSSNLSALCYANGFTLWHYKTADTAIETDSEGYFDEAAKMLRVGDFVFLNAGLGGTPTHGTVVVRSIANGTVDVSNATPFGELNTD